MMDEAPTVPEEGPDSINIIKAYFVFSVPSGYLVDKIDYKGGIISGLLVAGYIQQAVKGIVIIVNKWDLVTDEDQVLWAENTRKQFKFMAYAPVMFISAKTGRSVQDVMPQAYLVYQERIKVVPEAELRGAMRDAVASHNLPRKGKMMLSVKGVTQVAVNPPTFVFKVNNTKLVHFSYKRFLENKLRESFGFMGTPLRIDFKGGSEK